MMDFEEYKISFNDSNLKKEIRKVINKPKEDIYESDLENITELYLENNNISDISCLSNFSNLEILSIENNHISDISALSGLSNLKLLDIINNRISDISCLSNLSKLKSLFIYKNNIDLRKGTKNREVIDYLIGKGCDVYYKDGNNVN